MSTGESGISRPFTSEEYFQPCAPEVIVSFFCGLYGVKEPILKRNPEPSSGRHRGLYTGNKNLMSYNWSGLGLIIHELAHHIEYQLGDKDGVRVHHGREFSRILQEMIDTWR